MCGVEAVRFQRCAKHLAVEEKRIAKDLAKRRERAARDEAAWRARNVPRLPQMRVHLEQAEAEYARRTSSPTHDRAAVGGNVHPSILRAQHSHLSDSNVARVVKLERIIRTLKADIERAERAA